ncbi:hypothetical protein LGK95_08680 [Clostridium algoriphilum]|uniref:hypothetical protein n=1 Tax=Clostridium algoriphilum TaxID=198347 RepID=UPI001CF47E6B|nr:hypothetical protein [Clostridium algoriphilum]MCB2293596.1 hypothetical protein [Clostridium algoriphilum]
MKNKVKLRISIIIIIVLIFTGFLFYSQTHISIWKFNISKNELKDVLINTKDNSYIITNPQLVLELTQEAAKMERIYKIESVSFPLKEANNRYKKLMIQTNITYGGSFWQDGNNGIMMNSNGYYWSVSPKLIKILDNSLKEAQILR